MPKENYFTQKAVIPVDVEVLENLDHFPVQRPSQTEEDFLRVTQKTMATFVAIANHENPFIKYSA